VANYGTIATTLFNAARALSPTGTVPIKDKEKQVANDIQGYAQDLIERAETRKNTAEAELRRPVSPPSDARSLEDIDTELTDAESTLSDLNRRSIWTTIGIMAAAAVLFPPFLGWLAAGIAPSVVGTVVLGGGGALSIYNYNKNFKEGRQNSKKIINDNRKYRARIARARLELQRATTDYTQLVGDGMSIVGRFENVSNISNAYETKIQEDIADIESRIVRMESDAQNDWNTANGLIPADGTVGKGEYLARLTEGDDILKIENTPPSDNSFADLKKQFEDLKTRGVTDIAQYQAIEAKAIALQTKFNDLHLPDLLTASNPHNVTDRHNNIVTSIENSKNAFATRNLEIQELVNAGSQIGGQSAKDAFDATTNNYAAQYATASGVAASYRTAQLENIHADAVEREMTYRTDLVSAWNDYAKDSTAGVGLKAKVDSCSAMGPAEKSDYGAVVSSLGVLKTMIDSQNAILTSGTASDTDKQIARTLRSQALAKADVDIALARCYAKLASEPDATKQSDIKNAIADIKQIKTNMSLANTDPNFLTPEAASTNASARMATLESSLTTERIYNISGLGLVKASQLRTMLDNYKDTIVPAAISADEGAWNALVGVSGAARGPLEAARTSTQTTLQTQREILEHLITAIKTEDPSFVTTDYDTKVTEAKTQENKANPEVKVKDPVTGKEYTQSELETVIQDLFDSTKIGSVEALRTQAYNMNTAAASMSGTAYATQVANRTNLITGTNGLRDQIEVAKRLISLCDSSYGTTFGATYGAKITNAENERDKVLPNKQFSLPIVGVMSEEDIAKEIEARLNALRTKIGDAQTAFNAYNSDYVAGRDTSSTKPAWEAVATTDSDSVKKQADKLGEILQAYKSAGGTIYRSGADESA
ncbi:MAG: hypothetical protein IJY07_01480, partial [Clostridia bacterium]|nr:hypothetical protein [Clostridia bacterium]